MRIREARRSVMMFPLECKDEAGISLNTSPIASGVMDCGVNIDVNPNK